MTLRRGGGREEKFPFCFPDKSRNRANEFPVSRECGPEMSSRETTLRYSQVIGRTSLLGRETKLIASACGGSFNQSKQFVLNAHPLGSRPSPTRRVASQHYGGTNAELCRSAGLPDFGQNRPAEYFLHSGLPRPDSTSTRYYVCVLLSDMRTDSFGEYAVNQIIIGRWHVLRISKVVIGRPDE